jgi:hypothetical protein
MERAVQQEAVQSLLDVAAACGARGFVRLGIPYCRTDMARNNIVEAFCELSQSEDDTLVMLDCDHVHPPDVVERLAARPEGVVGALAFRRSPPHEPMWFVRTTGGKLRAPAVFEPLVYECAAVGSGAIAIKRWVFDRLNEHAPYFFKYEYCEGGFSPSEDMWFAGLCERAGIKHHVDCSLVIPHVAAQIVDGATWECYRSEHEELLIRVEVENDSTSSD